MARAITQSASLVHLRQAVLLRNPVARARTRTLGGDESVRADAVGPGVFALHGVERVGDQVGFAAVVADGVGSEGAGARGLVAADLLVGGGEGEGREGREEEGEDWELHFRVGDLGSDFVLGESIPLAMERLWTD
jgi:hypothetical protein